MSKRIVCASPLLRSRHAAHRVPPDAAIRPAAAPAFMRPGKVFEPSCKHMLLLLHMNPLFHMKSATKMVVVMVDAVGIGRLLLQGMLDFLLLLTSAATAIEPRSNSRTCTAAHALCIVAMQHAH